MNQSSPKRRLNREDWLSAGLQLLSEKGIGSVTIDRLAARLGITRGSFYHHFENRKDLLTDMLEYWIKAWTLRIRDDMSALGLEPETTLLGLIKMIRHRGAANHDAAVRAWAMSDPLAADYVRRADSERLAYVKSLFEAAGFEGLELESRARMYLYYEAFEPMMFAEQEAELEQALIEFRHGLLLTSG